MEIQVDEVTREQARSLFQQGKAHVKNFRTSRAKADIDHGVELTGRATQLMPRGSVKWLDYIMLHAYYLEVRYQHFNELDDATKAIQYGDDWLSEASQDHKERPMTYLDVGDRWMFLFHRNGDRASLEKVLSYANSAYAIISIQMMWHQRALRLLAKGYNALHTHFPDESSYDKMLQALEKSYEVAHHNNADDVWIDTTNLSFAHARHWDEIKDLEDAKKALPAARHFVTIPSEDDPKKPYVSDFLGQILLALYNAGAEPVSALEEAIRVVLDGLKSCTNPIFKAPLMDTLVMIYMRKFDITELDELSAEEAIRYARESLLLTPSQESVFQLRRQNLAGCLRNLYDLTGKTELLDEGIQLHRQVLATENLLLKYRAESNHFLSIYLNERYEFSSSMDDIDEAIFHAREAILCTPETDEKRRVHVRNLGAILQRYAARSRKVKDYDECLNILRHLVETTIVPEEQNTLRYDLSVTLFDRYKITESLDDWSESLSLARNVHDATSSDHPVYLAQRAFHLGCVVYDQYVRNPCEDSIDSLNESIKFLKQSVNLLPDTHRLWAGFAWTLGARQFERNFYYPKGSPESLKSAEEMINTLTSAYDTEVSPMQKLKAGRILIIALREVDDWQKVNVIGKEVLALFSKINPRSLSRRDMQENLKGFTGLSSKIAINALKAGESPSDAFSMLETGHGRISDMVVSKRSDVALLEVIDADLGSKYLALLDTLSSPPPAVYDQNDFIKLRQETLRQVLEVEDQIRAVPGLERFQLPPSIREIQQLAESGPLVTFTVDHKGSVAFVITKEKIDTVPLPKLLETAVGKLIDFIIGPNRITKCSITQRKENNTGLKMILKWLWDTAVKPVMDHLGFEGKKDPKDLPQVWWITNGLFGLFPMHAAGSDWDRSFENTASRCISSYISTTKALARARQKSRRLASSGFPTKCVAVQVPHTPEKGWPDLQTAKEMEQIRLQGSKHDISVDIHTEPTVKQLLDTLSPPDKHEDVTNNSNSPDRSETKTILHLACHGDPNDSDPSETALLLCNPDKTAVERLSVARLFELNQDNAYLAYLSACCTAQQYSKDLIDESMHLGNLFQLLGFSHVIGTLWEADDSSANTLAGNFYRRLFETMQKQSRDGSETDERNEVVGREGRVGSDLERDGAVARCLHEALIELRAKKLGRGRVVRDDVIAWANFVHLGA